MSKIIGIDLGTTNSCVSILENGKPIVINSPEGNRTTPSVVAVAKTGERLVGQSARRQAVTNPAHTISGIKRLMGQKFDAPEVQKDINILPYRIKKSSGNKVAVEMNGRDHSPEEISSFILAHIKKTVEDFLGEQVTEAVITVPAYFDDNQRQATKDAGKIAGLNVLRIINEPTAAALAYGLDKEGEEKIVVFDLGGGTFDISILDIGDGVFEVKATNGDTHLGGEDFDLRILEYLADTFKQEQGIDLRQDAMALQRLKEAAEKAKKELSTAMETEINLPFITADSSGPKHLVLTLTRAKLESLISGLLDRLAAPCETAVSDAGLDLSGIGRVILVGGMTRMPAVQDRVAQIFGRLPDKGVNPDEVVAMGAAIQGGIIKGDIGDVLLLDVTPLSLGIETLGGVMTRLIDKNTTVPVQKSQVFSTADDNQDAVMIHVLQGEREMAVDNKALGRFELTGIAPAPRGTPQIEVRFDIDANGIVNVSATDKATGKAQSITITSSSGLSKEEVEEMIKDARRHEAQDRLKKAAVQARNEADALIYQSEKLMDQKGGEMDAASAGQVRTLIRDLRQAMEQNDTEKMTRLTRDLGHAVQSMGGQAESTARSHGPDSGDDVVDAEFSEVA